MTASEFNKKYNIGDTVLIQGKGKQELVSVRYAADTIQGTPMFWAFKKNSPILLSEVLK